MTFFARRAEGTALVAAFAIRLFIAWAPMDWLLRTILGDDPFYYFTIARNVGRGHGFTFDTIAPTDGFHPLWMIVIWPVFKFVQDPALAIHAALTVSALCDVAALALLCSILRNLDIHPGVAAFLVALYAISPILISSSGPMNGLETALNLAVTFAFLSLYRRALVGPTRTVATTVLFGVSSGILFLARTDNIILLGFTHAFLLWRQSSDRARIRHHIGAVLVASVVAAPWLLWVCLKFGSPVQVSGLAVAYFMRAFVGAQGWTGLDYGIKFLRNLGTVTTYFPVYHRNIDSFTAAASGDVIVTLALAGGTLFFYRTDSLEGQRALLKRLAPWGAPVLAGGVFVFVHTLRAVDLRGWYYASLLPASYLLFGIAGDYVVSRGAVAPRWTKTCLLMTGTGVLILMFTFSLRAGFSRRCGEIDGYNMIRAVNDALPDDVLLGSWNAGLFGYFYEKGNVVNLDGSANNGVYDSIKSRSLGEYVTREHIGYLLDAAGAMELVKPYWNGSGGVSFPEPVLENSAIAQCRRIRLVPVP